MKKSWSLSPSDSLAMTSDKSLRKPTVSRRTSVLFVLLLCLLNGYSACSFADKGISNPSVTVPPATGKPFIRSTSFPLGDVGYEQAEFFVAGTAHSYLPSTSLSKDGKWSVASAEQASYNTRMLVYRPTRAEDFNGTVIVEWLNVSGGTDAAVEWVAAHNELIRSGYAWVGVSAQRVGVEGGSALTPGFGDTSLKAMDGARYGSLLHPGDSFSYDIFSQAAQAVLHPGGIDPLGGLKVRHMIAAGVSQSAFRLMTYVNAFAGNGLFDGFFIHGRGRGSASLSEAPQAAVSTPTIVTVRDDLKVPVMMLQTETDVLFSHDDRQADSDHFRLWEVAGTGHADLYTVTGASDKGNDPIFAKVVANDNPIPGVTCYMPVNSGPAHFVVSAALAALQKWISAGTAPPTAPRLELSGSLIEFIHDELGIAQGGVRTPYVDVPIATLSGQGQFSGPGICMAFGSTRLFDGATLARLYPTHAAYMAAVDASVDHAVANGFLLAADGALIKTAAKTTPVSRYAAGGIGHKNGVREVNPRYVVKGAEIYDKVTDLTWQRCSIGQRWQERKGCVGTVKTMTLVDAKRQENETWRLPTRDELITLFDDNRIAQSQGSATNHRRNIDEAAFPNMNWSSLHTAKYWSSGTFDYPGLGAPVNFNVGRVDFPFSPSASFAVRLVHEGAEKLDIPEGITQMLKRQANAWARQDLDAVMAEVHPRFGGPGAKDFAALRELIGTRLFSIFKRYEFRVRKIRVEGNIAYVTANVHTDSVVSPPAPTQFIKEGERWYILGNQPQTAH